MFHINPTPKNSLPLRYSKIWITSTAVALILLITVAVLVFLPPHRGTDETEVVASVEAESVIKGILIEQISNYQPVSNSTEQTVRGAPNKNTFNPRVVQPPAHHKQRLSENSNYTIVTSIEGMQKEDYQGSLLKPTTETVEWLHSSKSIDAIIHQTEKSNRDWTYGWIQLAKPKSGNELEQDLSEFDTSIVGVSGAMVRVKFPKDRKQLEEVSGLSWVQGMGVQPQSTKVAPDFDQELATASTTLHPIFITIMSVAHVDEHRHELESLGVEVGHFDSDIRVFEAVATGSLISSMKNLDFVQSIEPIGIARSNHDSAVPAMGVDAIRSVGETLGEFSGFSGSSIPIAVADTGLNTNHVSISSFRESICGKNFVPNEDVDLWIDEGLHGTHVTGTVAGVGYYQPWYAGMAPGVQDIRFAKVLGREGGGAFSWIYRGMDFLATYSSCPSEGWSDVRHQPLIVNMSLSATSLNFDAKSTSARKLDSLVWSHRQLYTVAASNSDIHGYSNFGAAKNSLAVGASFDEGEIVDFSSQGPTVDGRLFPNVTATGVGVVSALGNRSFDGYQRSSGTSMSSPATAGVAALIMDASPSHQRYPALIRARLMASAIKPDSWFDSKSRFPSDNSDGPGSYHAAYGLGFVSARTSIVNLDDPNGWTSSGITFNVNQNEIAFHDIEVPVGTSRLDVVLTWDEPSSDTIANVVLNDLDLYLDHEADCGTGACGEHSSQSSIDNVEWIVIEDPGPGTYRIKVLGSRVFTKLRGAVAWTLIRGASTPQLSISTDQTTFVRAADSDVHEHSVEITIESSGYVASGTILNIDCRTQEDIPCSSFRSDRPIERYFLGDVDREDGLTIRQNNENYAFSLGEVAHGEKQRVTVHLFSELNEDLNIHFTSSAFNAQSSTATVKFVTDDSDGNGLQDPEPLTNDDLITPMVLTDREGSIDADTLLATTESGESGMFLGSRRSLRSLWYEWQPNSQELVSFVVSPKEHTPHSYSQLVARTNLDVFEVDQNQSSFSSLNLVGSAPWSIQWFPKLDQTYRIRVSGSQSSQPLTMSWFVGATPVNDDFANAVVLSGESGTIDGHNLGATIEEGEVYGSLAASIWYEWQAPSDGVWIFEIEKAQVVHLLIFTGDAVDNLRLVSGFHKPGSKVLLEAAGGETYYLMVCSPDALSGGWRFEALTWKTTDNLPSSVFGDSFDDALSLQDETSGRAWTHHTLAQHTIEPSEPEITGTHSIWMKWTAPETGLYTWYWNEGVEHQVNVLRGETLDSLISTPLDITSFSRRELLLDAEETQTYYFSVGLGQKDAAAFSEWHDGNFEFFWGFTPANNTMSSAIELTGSDGSIRGESQYATTAPIGLDKYGVSPLWYTYTAEESGWYRFRLKSSWEDSYILTALQQSNSDNEFSILGTSLHSSSFGQGVELIIHIEAGESIFLRVGNKRHHNQTNFVVYWESTPPPQWVKYIGRLGGVAFKDAANQAVNIQSPGSIEFDDTGRSMFVSSETGLLVFERNNATGALTFVQELNDVIPGANMIWDSHRERLYVTAGKEWWVYKRTSDSVSMELDYSFTEISEDPIFGTFFSNEMFPSLHMGKDGNYLYHFRGLTQNLLYGFSEEGKLELIHVRYSFADMQLQPHLNGSHWYSLGLYTQSARLLRRDVGRGSIRFVSESIELALPRGYTSVGQKHVEDGYIFTMNTDSFSSLPIGLYSSNLAVSELTDEIHENFSNFFLNCYLMLARPEVYAVDVLCSGGTAVIEYLPDSNELVLQDLVTNTHLDSVPDRFGRTIPQDIQFQAGAESANRKHIYVSTRDHGILTFERIGIEAINLDDLPPLVKRLDLLKISDDKVEFGSNSVEAGCLEVTNQSINDVSYTVQDSKWQQRDVGSDWKDVEGSNESDQMCSRALEETKEYRLVATISVDGVSAEYASNFIGKVFYERLDELEISEGEVELAALSTEDCMAISNITIDDVTYSVETSRWQSRTNSEDEWDDVSGTVKTRELCVYDEFNLSLEYRLVGTFLIDDDRGYYTSNVLVLTED